MNRIVTAIALVATFAAAPAEAQGRGKGKNHVPPGHLPPAGMCRIWIDGVPPGQQPAPTDCSTAVRNRPANGRVLFGDDAAKPGSSNKWKNKKGRDRDDDRRGRDDDDRWEHRDRDDDDRYEDRRRQDERRRDGDFGGWERGRESDRDRTDTRTEPRTGSGPWGFPLPGDRAGTSRTLPLMTSAVIYSRGQRSAEVARWLGTERVTPRLYDGNRDGRPERVTWYDVSGRIRQVWYDTDRDGRSDRVDLYENGRRVRSLKN